ncbi:ComEA family DNA-binding protein [Paenibacillus agricola]|nr:helix-hairpin-helix domain-containing protein [Paenibacillus agricola]
MGGKRIIWMLAIVGVTLAIIGGWVGYKAWERALPEASGWYTANEEMQQLLQKQTEEKRQKQGSAEVHTKGPEAAKKSAEVNKKPAADKNEPQVAGTVMGGTDEPAIGNEPAAEVLAAGADHSSAGKQAEAMPATSGASTTPSKPTQPAQPIAPSNEKANNLIPLNKATEVQLVTIPGIGESKAKAILAHRKQIGSFQHMEQLLDVKGIGEKLLEKMRPYLIIEP